MRMQPGRPYIGFLCPRCGKFQALIEDMQGMGAAIVLHAHQLPGSTPARCEDCGHTQKSFARSHLIRRRLEEVPRTQRSKADAPLSDKTPQKALVFKREGSVWEYDVVYYEEAPWLVAGWIAIQGQSGQRPTRLISMSSMQYQELDPPDQGRRYTINDALPASIFDAPIQQLVAAGRAVLDEPLLTFEIEKSGPRFLSQVPGS